MQNKQRCSTGDDVSLERKKVVVDAWEGIRDGLLFFPIYLPIAVPYAIAATLIGFEPWQVLLWSSLIFAGSSQLACVGAIPLGAGLIELLTITFMTNIRHGFVSMSVLPYIRDMNPKVLPFFSFTMATTSAGLLPVRAKQSGSIQAYGLAAHYCQWAQWVAFTLMGLWLGPMISQNWEDVIYFAVPAGFIGLMAPMVRENVKSGVAVVVVSGGIALGFSSFMNAQVSAIIGALIAAALPLMFKDEES